MTATDPTARPGPARLVARVADLPGPRPDRPRAVVMTMGALHAGHAALVRTARTATAALVRADPAAVEVVVTVFVNPLQFGAGEDFDRYPRSLPDDVALCAREGADVVLAPAVDDLYPDGAPQVTVDPGALGAELEGAARPGHFAGVLTVVAKLAHLVGARAAVFGEKDYQQLTLVRRMAHDLDMPVEVVGVPTVREPDGLALSSRNVYLDPVRRGQALALPQALAALRDAAAGGADLRAALPAARAALAASPGVDALDYLELRGPDMGPAPRTGPARLLAAARVGPVRLLDNVAVDLAGPGGPPPAGAAAPDAQEAGADGRAAPC